METYVVKFLVPRIGQTISPFPVMRLLEEATNNGIETSE